MIVLAMNIESPNHRIGIQTQDLETKGNRCPEGFGDLWCQPGCNTGFRCCCSRCTGRWGGGWFPTPTRWQRWHPRRNRCLQLFCSGGGALELVVIGWGCFAARPEDRMNDATPVAAADAAAADYYYYHYYYYNDEDVDMDEEEDQDCHDDDRGC